MSQPYHLQINWNNPKIMCLCLLLAATLGFFSGRTIDAKIIASSEASTSDVRGRFDFTSRLNKQSDQKLVAPRPLPQPRIFPSELWLPSYSLLEDSVSEAGEFLQTFYLRKSLQPNFKLEGIEGRFDLTAPGSFIDLGMGSKGAGSYVFRIMQDAIAVLYSISEEERLVVHELLLEQPIGTGPLRLSARNNHISLDYYGRRLYSFKEANASLAKISVATNLSDSKIISLVIDSIVGGVRQRDAL